MSNLNQLPAPALLLPIDATAAAPAIQIGGGVTGSSGTGIYGDATSVKISVAGVLKATIDASGINGTVVGLPSILALSSAATVGGAATENVVVTGLLATDTILSVSQSVPGASSLPLLGFNTLTNGHLTLVFSADPGAGAIVVVAIKR